jgi:hypothetical protein
MASRKTTNAVESDHTTLQSILSVVKGELSLLKELQSSGVAEVSVDIEQGHWKEIEAKLLSLFATNA